MTARPAFDDYQRRRPWLAVPIAVFYKFFDDQGGYLAALITYYGFVSLFPLLLLAVTVLGFVLQGDASAQAAVLRSALSQFPIVGEQIQTNLHAFRGSTPALVIGIVGSLYGGLGVAQAGQNAMHTAWEVPRNERPNPLRSRLRSLAVLGTLGIGVLATTGLSALTTGSHSFVNSLHLGVGSRLLAIAISSALNLALFVVAFRLLTVRDVPTRALLPGAIVSAVAWQVLQAVGTYYIAHELKGASEVYGLFGLVLGLVAWIHLEALVVVLCAELNVVLHRRLWPRALLTPFTDDVDLTSADERAYASYAEAERAKGFEHIEVDFDHDDERPQD